MRIYPAIDIKDGKCVRLRQGDFSQATVFADDPTETAKRWLQAGAAFLHVVDLDGAKQGASRNDEAIGRIAALGAPIQAGGGIRSLSDIEHKLALGVTRVIIGTAAVTMPTFAAEAASRFGDAAAVGIDARMGLAATDGWLSTGNIRADVFADQMSGYGVKTIIYTDISKDGMMNGPNLEETARIADVCAGRSDVIASGGVTTPGDLSALRDIGVSGVIIGRALFDGTIDLAEAIRIYE